MHRFDKVYDASSFGLNCSTTSLQPCVSSPPSRSALLRLMTQPCQILLDNSAKELDRHGKPICVGASRSPCLVSISPSSASTTLQRVDPTTLPKTVKASVLVFGPSSPQRSHPRETSQLAAATTPMPRSLPSCETFSSQTPNYLSRKPLRLCLS